MRSRSTGYALSVGAKRVVYWALAPLGLFFLCAAWPPATDAHTPGFCLVDVSEAMARDRGTLQPTPVNGWIPEYDIHVQAEVMKAPQLLELPAATMQALCPKWAAMNGDQRARFYADLLFAIAGAESRWKRTAMFKETGIVNPRTGRPALDIVTGYPIVSEGLLQLSYTDMRNYRPLDRLSCAFDWPTDKIAFLEDLTASGDKKSFHSHHPERSILDPYAQLTCGVHILNTLIGRNPGRDFTFVAGRYWSTMRQGTSGRAEIQKNLESRQSACF
jgi:hypothetical protein